MSLDEIEELKDNKIIVSDMRINANTSNNTNE
jgi:hypothetical protein